MIKKHGYLRVAGDITKTIITKELPIKQRKDCADSLLRMEKAAQKYKCAVFLKPSTSKHMHVGVYDTSTGVGIHDGGLTDQFLKEPQRTADEIIATMKTVKTHGDIARTLITKFPERQNSNGLIQVAKSVIGKLTSCIK